MSKAKTENYTKEQVSEMIAVYTAAETDEDRKSAVIDLSESFGKTPASIRAKLVSLDTYVKPTRKAKDGSDVEKKEALVNEIADLVGASAESFDSLAKANKSVLKNLRDTLATSRV